MNCKEVLINTNNPETTFLIKIKLSKTSCTSYGYANIFDRVIKIIDTHRSLFEHVITKKIELNELVSEGIESLERDKKQAKILVRLHS